MKETLLRMFMTAILTVTAVNLSARDYNYITFKLQSGYEKSILIDGLKLTFSGNTLTAKNPSTTLTYSLTDLSKMFFSATSTGILNATTPRTVVSLSSAALKINAPVGTQARVFDSNGRLILSTMIGTTGAPVSINGLAPGIYLVKAGSETLKVLVK